ncbi:MAG: hypothetical protein ACR2N4_00005 [Jatrophihabitans sp.]
MQSQIDGLQIGSATPAVVSAAGYFTAKAPMAFSAAAVAETALAFTGAGVPALLGGAVIFLLLGGALTTPWRRRKSA